MLINIYGRHMGYSWFVRSNWKKCSFVWRCWHRWSLGTTQATPTIIEDNCFIGARSEIVEGVIVEKGSVISMGVYIGKSTRIYDRSTGEITYGLIPAGSVVVSGNLPSKDGKYSMYAAIIVKKVDEKTLSKVGINNILRDLD